MGSFMFQKIVNMTFFTDSCAWNFFFTKKSDIFFYLGLWWQTHI